MPFKSLAFCLLRLQIRRRELLRGAKGSWALQWQEDPEAPLLSLERPSGLPERARMVEAFCATWKLTDSQNFDEYMKALGR